MTNHPDPGGDGGGPVTRATAVAGPGTGPTCAAETVGFEPTVSFPTHAFQACRFGRSRTSPGETIA